ncbi:MAG: topB 3 [Mucilaginibacter sp.]|nr:topB 3 [Mucilaginibacter sp.]
MNLSRLFTLIARRCGHDQLLPVGRVQTPTLSLVVSRDRAISTFVKKPFWEVEVRLSAQGQAFSAKWRAPRELLDAEGRCVNQAQAIEASRNLAQGHALVSAVDVERVIERPPLPFDLATLQEQCDRQFGMGVEETLNIAQSLYETHKATHYPRTECPYLPESMLEEVPAVLDALSKTDPSLVPLLQTLNREQRSHCWDDKKLVGPHHGIIPTTEPADISKMSDKETKVYDLIRRRYLAQFLSHHEYDRAVVSLSCAGLELRAVGKQIAVAGWKALFCSNDSIDGTDEDSPSDNSQQLPALHVGQSCRINAS